MQVMETIFSQQSLFDKLIMVGEKKNVTSRSRRELITTYYVNFYYEIVIKTFYQ